MIQTDRSRIEARQTCRRKRLYNYHWGGRGIAPKTGRFDADFGVVLHEEMCNVLRAAADGKLADLPYLQTSSHWQALLDAHTSRMQLEPDQLRHFVEEQQTLLCTLVNGWRIIRLPNVLAEYEVVGDYIETEHHVQFDPADYLPADIAQFYTTIVLNFRMDGLLRNRLTGEYVIIDFKTVSSPSTDWSINLENSLQSNLYIAAAEKVLNHPVSGIMYEGLVKGRRELDRAKASPYNGMVINYGSYLYGWLDKHGVVHKDYVTGRKRYFHDPLDRGPAYWDDLTLLGYSMSEWFPTSVPWRPLDINEIVAQAIVNETTFHNDLKLCEQSPEPMRRVKYDVLFEQSLGMCYKFGRRHPCPFVPICHEKLSDDEIRIQYEERIPHHDEQFDGELTTND